MNLFYLLDREDKDLGGITTLQKIVRENSFKNPFRRFGKLDYGWGREFIKLLFTKVLN